MKMKTVFVLSAYALILSCSGASAAEIKAGDKAPSFEATDDAGMTWKSADHIGKKVVVVYFYPADFTGGCTKQACGFRDDYKTLADKGVEVIGISGDHEKTHELFKKEHRLPFTLLSDEKGEVAKAFGVPVKVETATAKVKLDGKDTVFRRGATISRWTFVIGKDGKVAYVETKVDAAKDSKTIAAEIDKLEKK